MNLIIITKVMQDYTDNIEINTAANGAESLEKVKPGIYDLIFVYLQMPKMDGYEASIAIRKLPGATGQIPMMALTAALAPTAKLKDAGMDDFLLKPFTRDALYDCLPVH